jgi:hypothetical protein
VVLLLECWMASDGDGDSKGDGDVMVMAIEIGNGDIKGMVTVAGMAIATAMTMHVQYHSC